MNVWSWLLLSYQVHLPKSMGDLSIIYGPQYLSSEIKVFIVGFSPIGLVLLLFHCLWSHCKWECSLSEHSWLWYIERYWVLEVDFVFCHFNKCVFFVVFYKNNWNYLYYWIVLKNIIQNEVMYTQKDKHHMISLIYESQLGVFRFEYVTWGNIRRQESSKGL